MDPTSESPPTELEILRAVVDRLDLGVFVKDTQDDYRFVLWNAEMERLFQAPRTAILGKTDFDLFAPAEAGYFRSTDRAVMAAGNVVDIPQEQVSTPSGPIHAHTVKHPIVVPGQRQLLIGFLKDISHWVRENELARQRQFEAEAASHAKSQFLANVSHELRTPLTAILGFCDETIAGELTPDEQQQAMGAIQRNARYLLQLINDLLDLRRAEEGELQLECQHCDIDGLLTSVRETIEPMASPKGLELRVRLAPKLPTSIVTDPLRLRQILVNLLANAIKFTAAGHVSLELQLAAADGSLLQIDVRDTGVGMTAAQAANLFRPFGQADASTSRQFGGSGLGLLVSRNLARCMGGDLELVATVPGQGSHFRARVRLAETGAAACHVPTRETRQDRLGARVLVAEDTRDNQLLLRRLLQRWGCEVTVVDDGRAAVDTALAATTGERPFDLILMDLQMPVLDGLAATRELRTARCEVPIVALTANTMRGDDQRSLAAGCNAHQAKPIDRAALHATLRRLLNKH
jgi:signal transduction histidine kinase/CheY-like chemotaxis protein